MKKTLKFVLLISLLNCCNSNNHSNEKTNSTSEKTIPNSSIDLRKKKFKYYFDILDSASRANPNDTIYYCCTPSISFMASNTGISADSDGTQLGQLAFTKKDLQKWHEWFDKMYKKDNSQ